MGTYENISVPLAQYRPVVSISASVRAAQVTALGVYVVSQNGTVNAASGNVQPVVVYLDPAVYTVAGYRTFLRLYAGCIVNDTAPATTSVWGLYPVGTPSGGVSVLNPNFGTVVTGSTASFVTPAANAKVTPVSSGDFAFPAAGYYGLGLSADGAMAANSQITAPLRLEIHHTV